MPFARMAKKRRANRHDRTPESKRLGEALQNAGCMDLLRPHITEEVRQLALKRLKISPQKLALLLVRLVNPDEVLTETERAILAGKSRDWMRKQRREGDGSR